MSYYLHIYFIASCPLYLLTLPYKSSYLNRQVHTYKEPKLCHYVGLTVIISTVCIPKSDMFFSVCLAIRWYWEDIGRQNSKWQTRSRRISKVNIKAQNYWPFVWGIHRPPVDSPHKRASNAESASMSWRHDETTPQNMWYAELNHWGRVTHICVSKLTTIGSDNGLSPGRHQAIIWINAEISLIGPLATNFSEIVIEIYTFSFKKMHLKVSSAKRRPFCLGPNVICRVNIVVISHC